MLQSLYRHQNNYKSTQWCVWCIPLFLGSHSVISVVGKERYVGVGGSYYLSGDLSSCFLLAANLGSEFIFTDSSYHWLGNLSSCFLLAFLS